MPNPPIASKTKQQIRQAIGDVCGIVTVSTASTTGSPTTLNDQVWLSRGGQDEYAGFHIMVNQSGTVAADYAKRFVISSSAGILTVNTALAATTVSGNAYELWKPPYTIDQINNLIAQAEADLATQVFVDTQDATTFTDANKYLYSIPTGFIGIHTIEFDSGASVAKTIDSGSPVWSELVDVDAVVAADTGLHTGQTWLKMSIAAPMATDDIIATQKITSTDLRDCTDVEISVFTSVALTSADLRLLLSGTASCATPIETLNIPTMSASTMARHILTLANPISDSAIISVGLQMHVDKGAFTCEIRNIKAVRANSRVFESLMPQFWDVVAGSTDYLRITQAGHDTTGDDCLLRIKGYTAFTAMASETTVSQVEPQYLIDRVSAQILSSHGDKRGTLLEIKADRKQNAIRTNRYAGSKFF